MGITGDPIFHSSQHNDAIAARVLQRQQAAKQGLYKWHADVDSNFTLSELHANLVSNACHVDSALLDGGANFNYFKHTNNISDFKSITQEVKVGNSTYTPSLGVGKYGILEVMHTPGMHTTLIGESYLTRNLKLSILKEGGRAFIFKRKMFDASIESDMCSVVATATLSNDGLYYIDSLQNF